MKYKTYVVFLGLFLAAFSLSSLFPQMDGQRRLASCIEGAAENPLPFDSQLFSHIQDEALRNSALQYYAFLTQVEMNALNGLDSARKLYGLPSMTVGAATNLYAPPTISNFQMQANPYHLGSWGTIPGSLVSTPTIAMAPVRNALNFGH